MGALLAMRAFEFLDLPNNALGKVVGTGGMQVLGGSVKMLQPLVAFGMMFCFGVVMLEHRARLAFDGFGFFDVAGLTQFVNAAFHAPHLFRQFGRERVMLFTMRFVSVVLNDFIDLPLHRLGSIEPAQFAQFVNLRQHVVDLMCDIGRKRVMTFTMLVGMLCRLVCNMLFDDGTNFAFDGFSFLVSAGLHQLLKLALHRMHSVLQFWRKLDVGLGLLNFPHLRNHRTQIFYLGAHGLHLLPHFDELALTPFGGIGSIVGTSRRNRDDDQTNGHQRGENSGTGH